MKTITLESDSITKTLPMIGEKILGELLGKTIVSVVTAPYSPDPYKDIIYVTTITYFD